MSNPLISIITVVYNGQATLEQTILSVLNQTYKNIEYIIIDGASTDGTVDIIKKYEQHLACWISEPDRGIYDAMNKGIDKAAGEWINFMNSGDMFYKNTALQSIFTTGDTAHADILYGDVLLTWPVGEYVEKAKSINLITERMIFIHQSSFVKTQLMKERKFDTSLKCCGDYNFFYHCYLDNKVFDYVPHIIATYNAEHGMSCNPVLIEFENAVIHNENHKIKWKIKYMWTCLRYFISQFCKKIFPNKLVLWIKKRNIRLFVS
jgi:glycosyltransferase involved in cell wall biosynthesis